MSNNNGFLDAMQQLGKLSQVNENVALDALEEAAEFFVQVLRPSIPKTVKNRKHLQDALKVKMEDDIVKVYFEDDQFYWRFVEHGTVNQRAQNFVRGTYSQNQKKIEEIMLSKIIKKMEA
ncbi:HK97-gp10 family putative phage morphogenesis protein [Listeria booriae]|uniref:HK97-gp10 family putative phage morphogenesis protein n=1 Tax=Listeria booriae TaxID=1552123 RepID=UPI00164EB989|nr:HK97-gp10 family putative phage morphogenesis protein [Listeria booriae]MBC6300304.1 hypothetical protein [Listeria booriae]